MLITSVFLTLCMLCRTWSTESIKPNSDMCPGKCQDSKTTGCRTGSYVRNKCSNDPVDFLCCTNVHHLSSTNDCNNLFIATRDSWGARKAMKTVSMSSPVKYFIVHHADGNNCNTRLTCLTQVKNVQRYHMTADEKRNKTAWWDVGYQYVIGEDGAVYEGRGWQNTGAHAPGYNAKSIGVCLLGNFMTHRPTGKATSSLVNLYECMKTTAKLAEEHAVYGHRDVKKTDCPGDTFYTMLKEMPAFAAAWHHVLSGQ